MLEILKKAIFVPNTTNCFMQIYKFSYFAHAHTNRSVAFCSKLLFRLLWNYFLFVCLFPIFWIMKKEIIFKVELVLFSGNFLDGKQLDLLSVKQISNNEPGKMFNKKVRLSLSLFFVLNETFPAKWLIAIKFVS